MNSTLLLMLTLASLFVAMLSATAVQVIHELVRHKLEEYCRNRGKLNWFSRIIELREELALGAQTLQMISIATAGILGCLWFFNDRSIDNVTTPGMVGMVGFAALILLAANCWVPRAVMNTAAPPFLYRTWRLWWLVSLVLAPLAGGVEVVAALFRRASGTEEDEEDEEEAFEDEIRSIVSEGEVDGLLEPDARDMIEGVIDLDDSTVGKVMTPRSRVRAIDVNTPWEELVSFVADFGHSRIPVFQGQMLKPDDVIGILFVKDLLREFRNSNGQHKSLREMARETIIVPESKLLDDLLKQFLDLRTHMAIVVDEYNSVSGVVTIEDILEEIVGEIIDESETEVPGQIHRINETQVEVDGTVHVDDLNEELGLELPADEDFDTIAGLIMTAMGRIPKRGDQISIGAVRIDIRQASRRAIERVRLTIPAAIGRDR